MLHNDGNRTKNSLSGRVARSPKSERVSGTDPWIETLFPSKLLRNIVCRKRCGLNFRSRHWIVLQRRRWRVDAARSDFPKLFTRQRFRSASLRHSTRGDRSFGKQNESAGSRNTTVSLSTRCDRISAHVRSKLRRNVETIRSWRLREM